MLLAALAALAVACQPLGGARSRTSRAGRTRRRSSSPTALPGHEVRERGAAAGDDDGADRHADARRAVRAGRDRDRDTSLPALRRPGRAALGGRWREAGDDARRAALTPDAPPRAPAARPAARRQLQQRRLHRAQPAGRPALPLLRARAQHRAPARDRPRPPRLGRHPQLLRLRRPGQRRLELRGAHERLRPHGRRRPQRRRLRASGRPLRSGATLACTWTFNSPISETDQRYNRAFRWSTTGRAGYYDVESAAAHETGHSIGLGHAGSSPFLTMYHQICAGCTRARTLARGDVRGMRALY